MKFHLGLDKHGHVLIKSTWCFRCFGDVHKMRFDLQNAVFREAWQAVCPNQQARRILYNFNYFAQLHFELQKRRTLGSVA